jgi:hypothetical protein
MTFSGCMSITGIGFGGDSVTCAEDAFIGVDTSKFDLYIRDELQKIKGDLKNFNWKSINDYEDFLEAMGD